MIFLPATILYQCPATSVAPQNSSISGLQESCQHCFSCSLIHIYIPHKVLNWLLQSLTHYIPLIFLLDIRLYSQNPIPIPRRFIMCCLLIQIHFDVYHLALNDLIHVFIHNSNLFRFLGAKPEDEVSFSFLLTECFWECHQECVHWD